MTPEETIAGYRRAFQPNSTALVRRYSGSGAGRPHSDSSAILARDMDYQPAELTATVLQGDRKVILFAQDLVDSGFALPLTTNDRIVIGGKELAIVRLDDRTRRVAGTLIAYELQVRG